jgi:transposase
VTRSRLVASSLLNSSQFCRAQQHLIVQIQKRAMSNLQKIHQDVAGVDVGACKFFVGTDEGEVQNFDTFTSGCYQLTEYLQQHNIKSVAMEATGVYWVTLYDMLSSAAIEVYVVNGRHVKHVPGRKTDVKDCMWIKELHSHGLLRNSFIAPAEVRELRSYVRIREKHIECKVSAVQRIDKALVMMNIGLSSVLSDMQGASAMSIIKAILGGERKPEELVELCAPQVYKKKKEEVIKSLHGFYKTEQLFALQQAFDEYMFYGKKMDECDKKITEVLKALTKDKEEPPAERTGKRIYHNAPKVNDLDKMMMQLYDGKDLTILPGMTSYSLLKLYAQTGNKWSAWNSEKHYTAWLGLAPSKYQSGKTRKYKKIKVNTTAGQILKECVQPLLRSKNNALGAFGRRISTRRGPSVAIKAMARKLACWIYRIMTKGLTFVENGIKQYQQRQESKTLKWLELQAAKLNLKLTPL